MAYHQKKIIKGLPKTTNSGGRAHWRAKATEAKKWRTLTYGTFLSWAPETPLIKAKITLSRCSSVEPDFDGLVSSFKHVIDGLVDAGIIQNDKPSTIGQPTYRWEKVAPTHGYIEVEVEAHDE